MFPVNSYPVYSYPENFWPEWGPGSLVVSVIKNYITQINYLLNFETMIDNEINMVTSVSKTLDYESEV
jgi:hypothetical protein